MDGQAANRLNPGKMGADKDLRISLCLTNYNRSRLLFEGVRSVLMDTRINEIIISDDCSNESIYNSMVWYFKDFPHVKIFRNESNIDCYHNKAKALSLASNDWCILFDSDNTIDISYINRIENLYVAGLNERTAYMPSFAKPHFNFQGVAGMSINRGNIGELIKRDDVQTMLNAMNYFVNRHEYLRVFDPSVDPVTSDSIYQNFRWLDLGNSIYVVPDMYYQHRVNDHEGEEPSHYGKNVRRTPDGFHEKILNQLKAMR